MIRASALTLCVVCVLAALPAAAQSPAAPAPVAASPLLSRSAAARVAPTAGAIRAATPPSIDGRIDDAAWVQAPIIDAFTQRDPAEGAPGSEPTEVRIVYDSEAIYVA